VNQPDDRELVRQLRAELGSVTVSPAPVLAVAQRGKAVRARRRIAALGTALAVVAVLAGASVATRPGPSAGTVTVNPANPSAPGGVFASGTADGARWALAVRNIDDPGSHRCRAAVMLNGRDGDVLFPLSLVDPTFGNPALLAKIPGLPAVSAMFTQVTPQVTKTVVTFNAGGQIAVRPVQVRECGHLFHLAGLLYTSRRGISGLSTTTPHGPDEALVLSNLDGGTTPGMWANLDKSKSDLAASRQATRLGTGAIYGGMTWQISSSLGLYGQCYTATLHGGGRERGNVKCVPVTMPPRAMDLTYVPVPGPNNVPLTGYAGLVSPRTTRVAVTLSDGRKLAVTPVKTTGRPYIAFAVPPDYWVTRLSLAGSAGRVFASIARMPPPGEPQPRPVPTFRAPSGVVPAGPAHRAPPGAVPG
jgi:hypothetical protein